MRVEWCNQGRRFEENIGSAQWLHWTLILIKMCLQIMLQNFRLALRPSRGAPRIFSRGDEYKF